VYAYDGDNIVEELKETGSPAIRYTQGLGIDEPLALYRGGKSYYYHADGLGWIVALSDNHGTPKASYTYDAFGNDAPPSPPPPPSSVTNPFRYTGRELDPETGLYYYRARYYDPSTGRFISEDPVRFQTGDPNFYSYAEGDPVDFRDPTGEIIDPEIGSGVTAGLNLTDYQVALGYLGGDPGCGGVIRKLLRSPRVFHLKINREGEDKYVPETHTIYWDPSLGVCCPGGGKLSPALGLCHEMAHAAGDGPIARHMAATPDDQYDTREERRVIRTYENPFAIRHHECVRRSHGGLPTHVPTPVSH
jgi:RHS repeat-associated protein